MFLQLDVSVGGLGKRLNTVFYGLCVQLHVTFGCIFGQGAKVVLCFDF